jgi:hypothetical protein
MAKYGRLSGLAGMMILLVGCQLLPTNDTDPNGVDALSQDLVELEALLESTRSDLQELSENQSDNLSAMSSRLKKIDGGVARIPTLLENACQRPTTVTTSCDEDAVVQTIIMNDDKMVVGELEHIWIDPPGVSLVGRIDTGTASNTLDATDIVEFERDGDNWVRFTLATAGKAKEGASKAAAMPIERKVVRTMRSSRRPVIRLRVRIGDVRDTYEFALNERIDSKRPVLLGRNFLKDVALVDVSRQFVQPQYKPTKKKSNR